MTHKLETLMGFDFGTKRIGVAVGQTITKTARALTTVKTKKDGVPWDEIKQLIKKWQPDALVVGIPLNMDGTEQPLTQLAKQFSVELTIHFHLPVYGIDERLSTKEARGKLFEEGGFKALQDGQVDSIAAQLILQNWLTTHTTE